MLPKIIEYLNNKSVLILGFGREGQSTLKYIRDYLPEGIAVQGRELLVKALHLIFPLSLSDKRTRTDNQN